MAKEPIRNLVAAAQRGDSAAFGEIVKRFSGMVYGYAYARLGDFHVAEDVAQESFLEGFKSLHSLRDAAAFPGWLQKIVRNHANRIIRRKRPRLIRLDDVAPDANPLVVPGDYPRRYEVQDEVRRAVRSLPHAQREAVALFYIGGYSQAEIAEFLGVPVNTVKTRLHTARQKLRERMLRMVRKTLDENPLSDDFVIQIQKKLGRPISEEEHKCWHREHPDRKMTPAEHRKFMKKMGVTEEEDRRWHEKHSVPRPSKQKS